MTKHIIVKSLPSNIPLDSKIEIDTTDVSYFTHGFFKYPCKFIPQIPRWAIDKYTIKGDYVLDPFAGSGTTLVEAVINGRNALGADFDQLSQLLCRSKTTKLNNQQVASVDRYLTELSNYSEKDSTFKPDINNLTHWFPEENIKWLSIIKTSIDRHFSDKKNQKVHDFLNVCFASIVKKVSFTDPASPKPYVSSKIEKEPKKLPDEFIRVCKSYLKVMQDTEYSDIGSYNLISSDARSLKNSGYGNKVKLAITSPPYINAFDYVRSLRLENAWLNYAGDEEFNEIKKNQIGTEKIYSDEYRDLPEKVGIEDLDNKIQQIFAKDDKRAHVVKKFFLDMRKNIAEVKEVLQDNGHYIIVVGNSTIRGINIPTANYLEEIALQEGYRMVNRFAYIIKNRYLRIPRGGKGGFIKYDWVIDLEKNGKKDRH